MKKNTKILPLISILLIVMLIATPVLVFSWDDYYYDSYDDMYYDTYDDYYYDSYDSIYYDNYNDVYYNPTEINDALQGNSQDTSQEYDDWTYDYFDDLDDPTDVPYNEYPDLGEDDYPDFDKPTEDIPVTIQDEDFSLQITGTRMPNKISQGDQLIFRIYVKNNGKKDIDNMKITLINQDLSLRDSVGPMDLNRRDRESRMLVLDFPQGIDSGYYYLRITVHAEGIDRVIYRDIYVA